MTAELGQPSLAMAAHVTTLARALIDLGQSRPDLAVGPDPAWSLELARNLLAMAGLATVARERPLVVNEACWEITHAGRPLTLTITQYRLLRELVLADDHTVPTPRLAGIMFGSSHHEHDRVAAHVKRLRRRLLEEGVTGCRIDTVRGFGYRLAWAS